MAVELRAEIAVVGGGLGGVAAALAAARSGRRTVLLSRHAWLGGQLTTQGVPPDEHRWIEMFGATASYRRLRGRIRDYYRRFYPLTAEARNDPYLNPGNAWVSRLAHEPRVAATVIESLLAPLEVSGTLTVLRGYQPVKAEGEGDFVTGLGFTGRAGDDIFVEADFFLDATETGELLPLAGIEYVTGAESQDDTGEPHAVSGPARPGNMQAITVPFALEHRPGEDHTIDKPDRYDFWRECRADFWPGPQLGFLQLNPKTLEPLEARLFGEEMDKKHYPKRSGGARMKGWVLWTFRRILAQHHFEDLDGTLPDVSMVVWPQNDYWLGPIIDVPDDERERHIQGAKQLSLSLLYWLQTEAPRPDGGSGYPGLRLRKDVFGTPDGLAIEPYIRESRRIRAEFTVLEQHLAHDLRGEKGAEKFPDSVGIGMYRIDLHPSTGGNTYIDMTTCPFQIPLGALIPVRMENLLPACKNIGTTHISSGAYRLHPIEWNIGEAAGLLASFCLERKTQPRQVYRSPPLREAFQRLLEASGIELEWPQVHPY